MDKITKTFKEYSGLTSGFRETVETMRPLGYFPANIAIKIDGSYEKDRDDPGAGHASQSSYRVFTYEFTVIYEPYPSKQCDTTNTGALNPTVKERT